MISWTTAREVPFEAVCTLTTSNSGSFSETGANFVNEGGGVTYYRTTKTIEGENAEEYSSGGTTNQTGWTTSFSSSYSGSELTTVSYTYTVFDDEGSSTAVSSEGSSASFSTAISTSSSESFSYPAFPAQTTTQTTVSLAIASTASTSFEYTANTTSLETYTVGTNTRSSTVSVSTSTTRSSFYTEANGSTVVSETTVTTNGSTQGNAADSIYEAGTSEVLWSIGSAPQYYGALTDNATSGTRFTASAPVSAVGMVTTGTDAIAQTIPSSESTTIVSYNAFSSATLAQTIAGPGQFVNAETSQHQFTISSNSAVSSSVTVSEHAELTHFGNTSTVPIVFGEAQTATRTDPLGSASHQIVWLSSELGTSTVAVGNLGGSGCAGNTTVSFDKKIGASAMAPHPLMSVYSPGGVAVGEQRGVRLTGAETTYLVPAKDGRVTNLTTIMPTSFPWLTISSNSVTFINSDNSSRSLVVGVDGSVWREIARQRGDGLVGGNLGESETGLIRFEPGLYKDQNGSVSFFSGNDSTYSGSALTSFWEPISYIVPAVGNAAVFAVPRNTSAWPDA